MQDSHIKNLSKAIQCKTVFNEAQKKNDYSEFIKLHKHLKEFYPLVHKKLQIKSFGEASLLYKYNGRNPNLKPLLLLAHQDVVPADDQNWKYPPFSGEISDGYVWGRGTFDMKFSLIAIFEALEVILKKGNQLERSLYIALGEDEEINYSGARKIGQYLSKQNLEFECVLDEGGLILSNALVGIKNPIASIGIAEKIKYVIKLRATSKRGHTLTTSDSNNAAFLLSKAVLKISKHPMVARYTDVSVKTFEAIYDQAPLYLKFLFHNNFFSKKLLLLILKNSKGTEGIVRTLISPTNIKAGISYTNCHPNEGEVTLSARALPGDTPERIIEHLKRIINDDRILYVIIENNSENKNVSCGT